MSLAVIEKARGAIADLRITPLQAKAGACAVMLPFVAVAILQAVLAKDYLTPAGPPLGGDYVAFWTAAKAMAAGDGPAIYDAAAFQDWLMRIAPHEGELRLTWQYPPTYFFVIGFLALLPYGLGYAAWTGGGFAIFAAASRLAGVRGLAFFLILAAPAALQAAITGQNGFLTAALFLGATLAPGKRPLLAGACAALLTIKPQLGLLIPIAYAAGGHWRAFAYAAAGAAFLAGLSVAVFGLSAWTAFFASVTSAGDAVATGLMPLRKMPTVFAALAFAGVPAPVAFACHFAAALAAVAATWMIWRRSDNAALKAAIVCAGAFLVAPYAYHYELVIMAAPLALLAMQAAKEGWRPYDHLILAELWLLPMLVSGENARHGLNLAFIVTLLAVVFVMKRLKPAA